MVARFTVGKGLSVSSVRSTICRTCLVQTAGCVR